MLARAEMRPRVAEAGFDDPPKDVLEVLDILENLYGPQKAAGPTDPYEMILYVNCGYPATDVSCSKGFEVLKREWGCNRRTFSQRQKRSSQS